MGKTLKELGNEIGLDNSTIGRFEKGRNYKVESKVKIEYFLIKKKAL